MNHPLKEHNTDILVAMIAAIGLILSNKDRVTSYARSMEGETYTRYPVNLGTKSEPIVIDAGVGWCPNIKYVVRTQNQALFEGISSWPMVALILADAHEEAFAADGALGNADYPVKSPDPECNQQDAHDNALFKPNLMWGDSRYASNRWAQLKQLHEYLTKVLAEIEG